MIPRKHGHVESGAMFLDICDGFIFVWNIEESECPLLHVFKFEQAVSLLDFCFINNNVNTNRCNI